MLIHKLCGRITGAQIFSLAILFCVYKSIIKMRETQLIYQEYDDFEPSSFMDTMKYFPWISYNSAVQNNNSKEIKHYSTLLLRKLVSFVRKSPKVPINPSCQSPPLEMPPSHICNELKQKRKIGVLLQFGFDVDALEIHLHELNDLVEKFFLIESVQAHSSYITQVTKPLIWDMIKFDARFDKFLNKIVHFIVDDASLSQIKQEAVWSRETQQEELRWRKFLEWNNSTKYFTMDDVIGFGDVDEITDRNNIYFLKNCKLPSDPIDIGIWFPFGGIDTVFMSDFRIRGHKYTFAEPTFWSVGKAMRYHEALGKAPTRLKGNSFGYLLGGMHLSRYAFPPFQMTKLLTKTSARYEKTLERLIEIGMLYASDRKEKAESLLNIVPENLLKRIKMLDDLRYENTTEADLIVRFPWFLGCNEQRYPSFYKKYDSRLDL